MVKAISQLILSSELRWLTGQLNLMIALYIYICVCYKKFSNVFYYFKLFLLNKNKNCIFIILHYFHSFCKLSLFLFPSYLTIHYVTLIMQVQTYSLSSYKKSKRKRQKQPISRRCELLAVLMNRIKKIKSRMLHAYKCLSFSLQVVSLIYFVNTF